MVPPTWVADADSLDSFAGGYSTASMKRFWRTVSRVAKPDAMFACFGDFALIADGLRLRLHALLDLQDVAEGAVDRAVAGRDDHGVAASRCGVDARRPAAAVAAAAAATTTCAEHDAACGQQ